MSYYKNFSDGFHIKEKGVDYKKILALQDEFEKERNGLVLKFIPQKENIKILEIGSGHGSFAKECKKRSNIQYFGIEPEEKLYHQLKEQGFEIKQCFVPPIPFDKESFDVVAHFHVLEHLENSQKAFEFISDCARVIKKDGILIFRCPNALKWGLDFWDVDYTHSFFTSPTRIKQLIYDCDLELIHFEEISLFKPRHVGKFKYIIPTKINFLNKLYPKIAKALGKIIKKDTELLFVCKKNENSIN